MNKRSRAARIEQLCSTRHFLLQAWVVSVAILGVVAVLCVFALATQF